MFRRFHWPAFRRAPDGEGGGGAGGAGGEGGGAGGGGAGGTAGDAGGAAGGDKTGGDNSGGDGGGARMGSGGGTGGEGGVVYKPDGSYRDALPEDVRTDPSLANLDSVEKLAREHVNAQKLLGRKGVILPGENAKPEDWDKVYNALGRPAKADGYDLTGFKPPEGLPWNAEAQTEILPLLHKRGLTQAQLVGVMQDYAEVQNKHFTAMNKNAAKFADSTIKTLKKEWGAEADQNLDAADREARYFFDTDLAAARGLRLADGTYVLDHPLLAKAFKRVADEFGEDNIVTRKRPLGGGANDKGSAKAEIDSIRAAARTDKKHAYNDSKHPEHGAIHKRMYELQQIVSEGAEGAS